MSSVMIYLSFFILFYPILSILFFFYILLSVNINNVFLQGSLFNIEEPYLLSLHRVYPFVLMQPLLFAWQKWRQWYLGVGGALGISNAYKSLERECLLCGFGILLVLSRGTALVSLLSRLYFLLGRSGSSSISHSGRWPRYLQHL